MWIKQQRSLKMKKKLTPSQLDKLERIDFPFTEDPSEKRKPSQEYDILIHDLKSFKQKHGHVNVPKGSLLSVWLAQMKSKAKRGSIMKLWREELEAMGITFGS